MKIKTTKILLYFLFLISVGSLGFHIIEGDKWNLIDSIYMTVITLSTVGFGEVHELTDMGKIWAILLIIFGVSGVAVFISQLGENFMELTEKRRQRVTKISSKTSWSLYHFWLWSHGSYNCRRIGQ